MFQLPANLPPHRSELMFTSAEFCVQNLRNIMKFQGKNYTEFQKKYQNYCTLETWRHGYRHRDMKT